MHNYVHFFYYFSKYNIMQWYYILLIIFAIFVFISLPLFVQLRFYINAPKNLGAVTLLIMFIPISTMQFSLTKKSIKLIKKKKESEIVFKSLKAYFLMYFFLAVFNRIKIVEIYLRTFLGLKNNAMTVAMLNGVLITFVHLLNVSLFNKKGAFISNYVCDKSFKENRCQCSGYFYFFILPINILFAFFYAIKKVIEKKIKILKKAWLFLYKIFNKNLKLC